MESTLVKRSEAVHQRTKQSKNIAWKGSFLMLLMFLFFFLGCSKDESIIPQDDKSQSLESRSQGDKIRGPYEVTNLVADVAEYNPEIIDPNLVNAWGIALSPTGVFWISAAETELSVIYNADGVTLRPPVTMEGEPTGQVFNNTTGFVITGGPSRFIFVTEQGTITAWRSGDIAPTIVDNSASGASYTGVEIASNSAGSFIYVANVAGAKVDVFDQNWNSVNNMSFTDPTLPAGARPFNIQMIDGQLYVAYIGPGGGFVSVFNTDGSFAKRFASGGSLRAPWGITNTPPEFGLGQAILVGNFGDGKINVYNKNGVFKGQLGDEDGDVIVIDGLWALEFTAAAFAGTTDPDLYFTAGPDNETHGIFGEIEPIVEEEEVAAINKN